ncbi:Dscam [Cordylochernes scorpioides]|uniref:Dscam n=1 Tax=Cordylochernes scorpioides TaxID=51811 RepID=A0ABY6K103_9ARAC|nr:Dscam [Cordylochernes scorpioides]
MKSKVNVVLESPPGIQPISFPKNLKVGEKVSLNCIAIKGSPPFTIRWMKNGEPLESQSTVRVVASSHMSTIYFEPIDTTSGGNYTCEMSNKHGKDISTAVLNIQGNLPNIFLDMMPYLFSFYYEQYIVPPNNNYKLIKYIDKTCNNRFLSIKRIEIMTLHSRYKISLSISEFFLLNLSVFPAPPEWLSVPQDTTGLEGGSITVKCEARGSPEPRIIWARTDDVHKILSNSSVLVFNPVERVHAGKYRCTADNGLGPPLQHITSIAVHCECSPQMYK